MHIDEWLDKFKQSKPPGGEMYARFVLEHYRMPAWKQNGYAEWTSQFKLFCTYKGERYRVTGASRLGDIWLARDLNREAGYDLRVNVDECSGWSGDDPTLPTYHKMDSSRQVFFYEQEFYVLSNFSSFRVRWAGRDYDTAEAAYHCEKFPHNGTIRVQIYNAPSAHEAFKIAERNRESRRIDWDVVKVDIMRNILRAKTEQHEYVRTKLLETGNRELIEDSWRDDFWGWGPDRNGQNMLGKLWMEIRTELRTGALAV